MRMIIPTGLTALLVQLDLAVQRLGLALPQDPISFSARFVQRLAACRQELRARSNAHAELKHAWDQELACHRRCFDQLDRLIRDAWLGLRRRDQREQYRGQLATLYQLPRLAPQHASAAVWLEYGRRLVLGDELARQKGHAPMAFPSATELAACLAESEAVQTRYAALTLELKQAGLELRSCQREAAHLLRCLAARLRESQFEKPPAQTRNLLRSFGFHFKSSPGETEVAEVQVPELAQPAAPQSEPAPALAVASAAELAVACHLHERQPDHELEPEPRPRSLIGWVHKLGGGSAAKRWIA